MKPRVGPRAFETSLWVSPGLFSWEKLRLPQAPAGCGLHGRVVIEEKILGRESQKGPGFTDEGSGVQRPSDMLTCWAERGLGPSVPTCSLARTGY